MSTVDSKMQVLHAASLQTLRLLIVTCGAASVFNAHAPEVLAGLMNLILRDLVTNRTGLHFLDGDASLYIDVAGSVCACAEIMCEMLKNREYADAFSSDGKPCDLFLSHLKFSNFI